MLHPYSPLRAYQVYNSVSLHYGMSGFDLRKYNVMTSRFNLAKFDKARGKAFYNKLYNRFIDEETLTKFLGAAFYYVEPSWVGELIAKDEEATTAYLRYKKMMSAPSYHMIPELKILLSQDFETLCSDGMVIYNHIYGDRNVSPETICSCDLSFGLLDLIRHKKDDPIQQMMIHKLHKYNAFISLSNNDLFGIKKVSRTLIEQQSHKCIKTTYR